MRAQGRAEVMGAVGHDHLHRSHIFLPMTKAVRELALISCCARKADSVMPARLLYQSALFKKSVAWVELRGMQWFVLSAKHGLLHPADDVAPYDKTIRQMAMSERTAWAADVASQLRSVAHESGVERLEITLLAGAAYGAWLPLVKDWCAVKQPLACMTIGRRLQWLSSELAGAGPLMPGARDAENQA